jgi:hypothetical protein
MSVPETWVVPAQHIKRSELAWTPAPVALEESEQSTVCTYRLSRYRTSVCTIAFDELCAYTGGSTLVGRTWTGALIVPILCIGSLALYYPTWSNIFKIAEIVIILRSWLFAGRRRSSASDRTPHTVCTAKKYFQNLKKLDNGTHIGLAWANIAYTDIECYVEKNALPLSS